MKYSRILLVLAFLAVAIPSIHRAFAEGLHTPPLDRVLLPFEPIDDEDLTGAGSCGARLVDQAGGKAAWKKPEAQLIEKENLCRAGHVAFPQAIYFGDGKADDPLSAELVRNPDGWKASCRCIVNAPAY